MGLFHRSTILIRHPDMVDIVVEPSLQRTELFIDRADQGRGILQIDVIVVVSRHCVAVPFHDFARTLTNDAATCRKAPRAYNASSDLP